MIPDLYPQALPQAIIFDWDNTLITNWTLVLESINVAKAEMGLPPMTVDEFWAIPHHSVRDVAMELFGRNWKTAEEIYYANVKARHLEALETMEGAVELLEGLNQMDIYLAVVSNKHGDLLRRESTHLGWDHHFGSLIGSRDTEADKPSPIPVFEALKPATLKPGHHVWFIGDSIVDVMCAKNSGCVPVVVGETDGDNAPHDEVDIVHAKTCTGVRLLLEGL